MTKIPTVTIAGAEYRAEPSPLSVVYGHDLMTAYRVAGERSWHRLHAASLALACPRLARRIQRPQTVEQDDGDTVTHPGAGTLAEHDHDVIAYGGAVLAALLARGVSIADVARAGDVCGAWLIELTSGTVADEVDDAEGNSKPTP